MFKIVPTGLMFYTMLNQARTDLTLMILQNNFSRPLSQIPNVDRPYGLIQVRVRVEADCTVPDSPSPRRRDSWVWPPTRTTACASSGPPRRYRYCFRRRRPISMSTSNSSELLSKLSVLDAIRLLFSRRRRRVLELLFSSLSDVP